MTKLDQLYEKRKLLQSESAKVRAEIEKIEKSLKVRYIGRYYKRINKQSYYTEILYAKVVSLEEKQLITLQSGITLYAKVETSPIVEYMDQWEEIDEADYLSALDLYNKTKQLLESCL